MPVRQTILEERLENVGNTKSKHSILFVNVFHTKIDDGLKSFALQKQALSIFVVKHYLLLLILSMFALFNTISLVQLTNK